MARGRLLSASIATSESVNAMSEWAQLLWCFMIPHLDDFGTIDGSATKIKALTKPLSTRSVDDFARAIREIISVGTLTAYEVDGRLYLRATAFDDHQVNLHKRTRSKFPDPESGRFISAEEYENLTHSRFPEIPGCSVPKKEQKEQNRREENGPGGLSLSEAPPQDPIARNRSKTKSAATFSPESRELRAAVYLRDLLREQNPQFTEPNLQDWAKDFDVIFRIDGRDPELVTRVIDFVVHDENYREYLQSPRALRDKWRNDGSFKFDTWVAKMRKRSFSGGQRSRGGAAAGAAI